MSELRQARSCTPTSHHKMGSSGMRFHKDGFNFRPRRLSNADMLFTTLPRLSYPQTPPASTSASPTANTEGYFSSSSRECSPLPRLTRFSTPSSSPVRLPSLEEFDQGVEALARSHGSSSYSWTTTTKTMPPSPLPSLRLLPQLPHASLQALASSSSPSMSCSPRESPSCLPYPVNEQCLGYASLDGYPSPPPEAENRHINQKYTTEEGDFIIYAWHDKKLKWQRIKQDFAAMFGRTPERTVQGLQAWYYRMNQRIPLWDEEGWLIFDGEDDLEPKHISIKCRERDNQDKPMEPLGIAQRYPERAIHYSWVDSDTKRKARDWASKRALQYRERRERRKRKELRRMKL